MSCQDNRDNSSVNSGAVNRRRILLASTTLGVASALGSLAHVTRAQTAQGAAATPRTEQEAHAIGVAAYLYFYPLVTMDLTRKQLTNAEPGKGFAGPMNMFANIAAYSTAADRTVVRPNFDTLYSSAWLNLTKEPMIVSVPDTNGRYYLLPMLDMWTDVFASPGWRTTGTQAGNFVVTPPGWNGDTPSGMTRIDAPTPYVWIVGRTKTDGPPDYDAVHKIQAGYKITALSQNYSPPTVTIDPSVDMKTPPKVQVDTMPAEKYFAYAAELLKAIPPHITDQPIIAQLKKIGFEPGKSFELEKANPAIRKALESAPEDAQQLMAWKLPTLARVAKGWSMNTDTMDAYGNYYLKRAIIAQIGLGANLPEDAIYPINLSESLSTEQTNTRSISTRRGRLPQTPSGQSPSMTIKASKFQIPSIGLLSVVGCRSSTMRTDRSICISRTKVPALTRKRTGFPPQKPRSTWSCGSMPQGRRRSPGNGTRRALRACLCRA